MVQMAQLARDEEIWWEAELARAAPKIILAGRPVRGGGRAASDGLALEVARLSEIAPALQRRLLRYAAEQLGAAPDFASTESLRTLALTGRAGQKCELAQGLRAERTHRELRLSIQAAPSSQETSNAAQFALSIPGEVSAAAFGLRLQINLAGAPGSQPQIPTLSAILRNWKPGDRVRLRHSSGPRKVKEVLERMRVSGSARSLWPVVEMDGRIIWMQGVDVEPEPGLAFLASSLEESAAPTVIKNKPTAG